MAGNATVERELPGTMTLQVSYALNNAVGLYSSEWPNAYTGAEAQYAPYSAVNPGLGEFQLTDNHAHSTYNALQVQLRKVSSQHGLQFQAAYTWSKTIDNASTVWNGNNLGQLRSRSPIIPCATRAKNRTPGSIFPSGS